VRTHRTHSLFAAIFALLTGAVISATGASDFKAGLASVDITPPRGWRLAGDFTERVSTNTLSPLHARAIVFQQGRERAALEPVMNFLVELTVQDIYIRASGLGWRSCEKVIRVM